MFKKNTLDTPNTSAELTKMICSGFHHMPLTIQSFRQTLEAVEIVYGKQSGHTKHISKLDESYLVRLDGWGVINFPSRVLAKRALDTINAGSFSCKEPTKDCNGKFKYKATFIGIESITQSLAR